MGLQTVTRTATRMETGLETATVTVMVALTVEGEEEVTAAVGDEAETSTEAGVVEVFRAGEVQVEDVEILSKDGKAARLE